MDKNDKLSEIRRSLARKIDSEGLPAALFDEAWSATEKALKAGDGSFLALREGILLARDMAGRFGGNYEH